MDLKSGTMLHLTKWLQFTVGKLLGRKKIRN